MQTPVASHQSSVSSEPSSVISDQSPVSGRPSSPRRPPLVLFGSVLVIAFGLLGLFAFAWVQRQAPPLEAGMAPDWQLTTFEGETIRLADLKGKPVVLNFWASWCLPCREEAPVLQATWEKYRAQGLMVIGVDYVDTETAAKKYIEEFGITYPNGPDVGTAISAKFKITGVPETYFITREGKILSGKDANGRPLGNYIGAISAQSLQERVERLLRP